MILRRIEIQLLGPDEWPAEEGSLQAWERNETKAKMILGAELEAFLNIVRDNLPPEFEIEYTIG